MAILIVQGLAKYWGVDLLFRDVSFLVNEGEKVALVGRNGAGKTTLLKILLHRMEYDEGRITFPAGIRVGYLAQDPDITHGRTLLQEAESAFSHLAAWERELRALEARMGIAPDDATLQALMDEYAALTARFEAAGGYDAGSRTKAVLFGLGFGEADLEKPVEVLSGGQKVRLGLAKLLLEEPDLLLLDEPTNHLDLQATEWLEGYFRSMRSAAILVSHDRYFLDRVTTRTLEVEDGRATFYHGNYSFYTADKERRLEAQVEAYEAQQEEVARLQAFYEKWRLTPSRKDQAMARKRKLEKLLSGERPEEGLRGRGKMAPLVEKPKLHHKQISVRFKVDHQTGEDVLRTENLAKEYDGRWLFRAAALDLKKGSRVALVGPNGVGKTTFLKIINGMIPPSEGTYLWGVGVRRGYFSQDLDALDYTRTAYEEILSIPGFTKYDAHTLLGRFLFSGEDAYKPIAQCSGGERNRLILAKLMVSGANLLLLDEPTNHLDLESKQVLEEALAGFAGTLIFVSHDRYFVDQVATHIWEFSPTGTVTPFEGNYSAYRAEQERLALLGLQAEEEERKPEALRREKAKQEKRAEKRVVDELRRLEEEIHRLEERRRELEEQLTDPDLYRTAAGREVVAAYQVVRGDLERLYLEWEKVQNA
jgi:ATP-binding cassette, subfamily F, member 3